MATDPLARLLALREKPSRLVIGLLSGTSADGTDAALCEIGGSGESTELHVLAFAIVPFSRELRERIFRLGQADNAELADVDVLLGEAFADASIEACRIAGVALADVDLVGSHGQTAVHHPRSAGQVGATQLGTGQVGAAQVGTEQVGSAQIGAAQVGAVQVGAVQVSTAQVGAAQVGA